MEDLRFYNVELTCSQVFDMMAPYLSYLKSSNLAPHDSECPFTQPQLACDASIKYRAFDDTCNNLINPLYGSVNMPYERFLAPKYDDGHDASRKLSVNGALLPDPRVLSNQLLTFKLKDIYADEWGWMYSLVAFGQLIAHDITRAASSRGQ